MSQSHNSKNIFIFSWMLISILIFSGCQPEIVLPVSIPEGSLSDDEIISPDQTESLSNGSSSSDSQAGTGLNPNSDSAWIQHLEKEFSPDPWSADITGGGDIDVDYLNQDGCYGYVRQAEPDLTLKWTGEGKFLRIFFESSENEDGVLVVHDPNSKFYCNDDHQGSLDPILTFDRAMSGDYDIWIAANPDEGENNSISGNIFITQSDIFPGGNRVDHNEVAESNNPAMPIEDDSITGLDLGSSNMDGDIYWSVKAGDLEADTGDKVYLQFKWAAEDIGWINDFIKIANLYVLEAVGTGFESTTDTEVQHWPEDLMEVEYTDLDDDGDDDAVFVLSYPMGIYPAPSEISVIFVIHLNETISDGLDSDEDGQPDYFSGPFEDEFTIYYSGDTNQAEVVEDEANNDNNSGEDTGNVAEESTDNEGDSEVNTPQIITINTGPFPDLSPALGEIDLAADFFPNYVSYEAATAGDFYLPDSSGGKENPGCGVYVTKEPAYWFNWLGKAERLNIYFVFGPNPFTEKYNDYTPPNVDPFLLIRDPLGNWYCDDNSYDGYNPLVVLHNPPPGRYAIWLGDPTEGPDSYAGNTYGSLTFTQRELK